VAPYQRRGKLRRKSSSVAGRSPKRAAGNGGSDVICSFPCEVKKLVQYILNTDTVHTIHCNRLEEIRSRKPFFVFAKTTTDKTVGIHCMPSQSEEQGLVTRVTALPPRGSLLL
jgi:hypothetical protein